VTPKIGRNQPCPCGSGRKYKRCCGRAAPSAAETTLDFEVLEVSEDDGGEAFFDDLDRLSNRVPVLLRQGEIDEALRVCQELLRRYPDDIDWRERFAAVYEAQGDVKRAAAHYRQAADFARNAEGFDPEYSEWALEQAERLDPQPPDASKEE
jgi:tetratricopeptide (TPR) repeat protein